MLIIALGDKTFKVKSGAILKVFSMPTRNAKFLKWAVGIFRKAEANMAYGIVHFFPGGTKEQYEASLAAVHPSRAPYPRASHVYHLAGPFSRRLDDHCCPGVEGELGTAHSYASPEAECEGGSTTPPQEQAFEIYNLQP
jgi:hypothetical protein